MIHLTKKDFKIEWYSGTGAGGQHRNKHQNCCRITHIATGISSNGTGSKERITNQKEAFIELANRLLKVLLPKVDIETNKEVIRNYNESRNEVHDKASGLKMPYKMIMNGIDPMMDARRESIIEENRCATDFWDGRWEGKHWN